MTQPRGMPIWKCNFESHKENELAYEDGKWRDLVSATETFPWPPAVPGRGRR